MILGAAMNQLHHVGEILISNAIGTYPCMQINNAAWLLVDLVIWHVRQY